MYLFIFEDDTMIQQNWYNEEDLRAVGDGMLDIVYFDESCNSFYQLDGDGDFFVINNFP